MINRNAIITVVLAGLAEVASGCASTHTLALQQAEFPKEKVDARGLFAENCATCHGQNGRGRTFHGWLLGAQNFTDAHWQIDTSDAEIVHAINTGPGFMPAFEKKLSGTEIESLAAFVRTFKPAM
jgi:cytochrome c oxidase cbb3-type subunit 3